MKLRAGATEDSAALRSFLVTRISKIEMQRDIEFRDELPRTLVGKLSKKELRDT